MKENSKRKTKKNRRPFHIDMKFTFAMAGVFILLYGLDSLLVYLFTYNNNTSAFHSFLIVVTILASSILVGVVASYLLSRFIFSEFRKLSEGMDKIASGDFSVRLNLKLFSETKAISDSFNKMAESLASVEILKDDFISDFSHEFKTPLASIRGYINLLNDEKLSKKQRNEYLEIINEEITRLLEMSKSTLLISKLNAQNDLGKIEVINAAETLRKVLLLSEKYIETKHLELDVNLDEISFNYNQDLLKQIYVNLLSNSIKFSPEGGTIKIVLKRLVQGIYISFKDEGKGMDEETKKRIFDKYYQGDPSHSSIGAGLGLSIVKRIVELSNGSIEVESSLGKGSEFKVYLPEVKVNEIQ